MRYSFILEKVLASRLNSHINSSHTSNDYQSAYRKFHSTETALLNIQNDILSVEDWFNKYLGYLQCVARCTSVWLMLVYVDVIMGYMT